MVRGLKFGYLIISLTLTLSPSVLCGQNQNLIKKLVLRCDTLAFEWPHDTVVVNNEHVLPFRYTKEDQVCEIRVWLKEEHAKVGLIASQDFESIDTVLKINDYYRFKIRFRELSNQAFMSLNFVTEIDTLSTTTAISLYPFAQTNVQLYVRDPELFIGEEKVFELQSNLPKNVIITNEWVNAEGYDYLLRGEEGKLFLNLIPNRLGRIMVDIPLQSKKPSKDKKDQFTHFIPPISRVFAVENSRLRFLAVDPKEVTLTDETRLEGVEVQMDDSRLLSLNKTYRIENQEEPGGPLIAELFTKGRLANNRVLCILRPYNYHAKSDGYLYIKDGDNPLFVSNFEVNHATTIQKISILREGGEWKPGTTVYPGETIELKLEGLGLKKANFIFEDLIDISQDTILRSESQALFKLKVPVNISKKTLSIYNSQQATGKILTVSEHQKPMEFDFLYLSYGDIGRKVSSIRAPVLYTKTIKDVVITTNDNSIDKNDDLHGIQYFDIDVRVTGKKNELIEMRRIENVVVCPGDQSPRVQYYNNSKCLTESISLNKYLSKKTYDLDEWSKIDLTFKHNPDKYGGEGYNKEVEIILKRNYSFDVEVSFPAGLLTISKQNDTSKVGFANLSGISMAMIAQFSFYHPDKIAKYRPYKIGAGFLAFNAFNFSDDAENRDVGIVILGSIYPTTRDVKLSFPLYVGGGYFLKDGKWFFLIGPGIRVKL